MQKVMVGMSGGVDSSVTALLLQKRGYEVVGVTLRLKPETGGDNSYTDLEDARRVADKLGIEHRAPDFTQAFRKWVMDYFAQEYAAGRTPNPCVACNRHIKFGEMLKYAQDQGFDAIATGHYAMVSLDEKSRWQLRCSPEKDQSYVLYSLTQHQLSHTLFPLSGISKEQARRLAKDAGLPIAHKPDSQEICFVKDNDYAVFLREYTGKVPAPGNFVDTQGRILGRHRGISAYTIGQRKGLGISFGQPMYVCGIDGAKNEVVLGPEGSQYADALLANDFNWIAFETPPSPLHCLAKVRYQANPAACQVVVHQDGTVLVKFEQAQRSITPGQAVVLYRDGWVLGGGTIQKSLVLQGK